VLLCVTANHRTAPFAVLERLSVDASALNEAVNATDAAVRGSVSLATCNRVEVYLDVSADGPRALEVARKSVVQALCSLSDIAPSELESSIRLVSGPEAVHHLFSVASGLESVALGEEEIAGQVKRAALHAKDAGLTSPPLDRLFQHAARTARSARAEGDASRTGRSLVRLALDLVASRLVDWAETRVVLVGTGQYAATTVAALRDRGAQHIRVYSPSGRAEHFARRTATEPTHDLRQSIAWADVVVTCTSVLSVGVDDVPEGAQCYVIDLGMPRNVDPAVAEHPGVTMLDLEMIRRHAPLVHWSAESDARAVVDEAARAFVSDSSVGPAIVALRSHILSLVEQEVDRVRTVDADGRIEEALRHLAGVLLHEPSVHARRHAAQGRADAVADAVQLLFGVDVDTSAARHECAAHTRDSVATDSVATESPA